MRPFSKRLFLAATLATALAVLAHGRYITSLSTANPGAPTLTVLTDDLQFVGTVSVPSGAKQVLVTDDSSRLIVVAENATSPVSFVTIAGGALTQARTIPLGSGIPVRAVLSGDGTKLYVVTKSPAYAYVVDIAQEQAVQTALALPGDAMDAELTLDGQHLVVLCYPNLLTPIQLNNWQLMSSTAISGSFGAPRLFLSVAPFGSLYVTAPNVMIEFRGVPPFDEIARTALAGGNLTYPGKLHFIPPAGTRAFAANQVQSGHSVGVFDFTLRGANSLAGSYVGGAVVFGTTGGPFGSTPELVDPLLVTRDNKAIALAPSVQQVFEFNFVMGGGVSASDFRVSGRQLTGIIGLAASSEFPNSQFLYYLDTEGVLSRFPLSGIGSTPTRNIAPGTLAFVSGSSAAAPGNLYAYGAGRTDLAPGATVRYYFRAMDNTGLPVKGRTVTFRAVTAGVQLQQTSAVTNRDGWAWVDVTAPSAPGDFTVEAVLGNLAPLQLTSRVAGPSGGGGGGGGGGTPNQPRLIKLEGDGQLTIYGSISMPLVVQAVDADGKPIAGKQILWQTSAANLTFISPTQTTTDTDGKAQVSFFFIGSIPFNESYVSASIEAISDIGIATFYVSQYPADQLGTPTVQMQKPEPSRKQIEAKLGSPLAGAVEFRILSGGGVGRTPGLPIPNVGLRVTSENQDPTVGPVASCQEVIALSNRDGLASCTLVVRGKPGTTLLTANVGGTWDFPGITLTALPGDPVPPVIVSGNNQTGKTGTTLPERLVARIVDAGGNPLPGTQVTWSVSNPSALTLTDVVTTANANGEVSTRVQLGNVPGTFTVTVRAGDLQTSFTVTVLSTATSLRKVSGDGQPAVPVNTPFPQALVVEVLDAQGNPAANVLVTWSISGPGTLSATSGTTGTNGRTQVTVAAGSTAGTIVVTASVPGLTPVSFTLQSRPPGPAITAASFRNYSTGNTGKVAPGALTLLTGAGIAKNVSELEVATLNIVTGRLPVTLAGLVVEFRSGGNSYYAPIYWISREGSSETALIQVPYEISGPAVDVIVSIDGVQSSVAGLPVDPVSPGILEDDISGRRAAIVVRSDGLLATPATPARRGETVRLYAIGLGQTTPKAETNRVGQPNQKVNGTVAVGIDNAGVEVVGAKLAENLIGIYEVLFKIPDDAQLGDRPLGLIVAAPDGTPFYAQGSVIPIGPAQ